MFCPACGAEFRSGFTECADCHVQLVETSPTPRPQPGKADLQIVTVFAAGDPAIIAVARSILESAGIPFTTTGESLQDLFGWGRLPGVTNIVSGPVQFKVAEEDAEEALSLLQDLSPDPEGLPEGNIPTESVSAETRHETAADHEAVRTIQQRAFGRNEEAVLIELLRQHNNVALSMVAVVDDEVVAHIMFSPITVSRAFAGFRGVGLGPVAVLPGFQNNGIGSKLIRDALNECRRANYDVVVVLGNPAYYRRFGFSTAADHELTNEYGAGEEFMVMELKSAVLQRIEGLVQYSPQFGDARAIRR